LAYLTVGKNKNLERKRRKARESYSLVQRRESKNGETAQRGLSKDATIAL